MAPDTCRRPAAVALSQMSNNFRLNAAQAPALTRSCSPATKAKRISSLIDEMAIVADVQREREREGGVEERRKS